LKAASALVASLRVAKHSVWIAMDPAILAKKLYEISAEKFGAKIIEFYEDLIALNHLEREEKQEEVILKKMKMKLPSLKRSSID
jgi:1,2-diacylglycerol 3-alpha-glucosyltransferase